MVAPPLHRLQFTAVNPAFFNGKDWSARALSWHRSRRFIVPDEKSKPTAPPEKEAEPANPNKEAEPKRQDDGQQAA